jgi:hypothetical protein
MPDLRNEQDECGEYDNERAADVQDCGSAEDAREWSGDHGPDGSQSEAAEGVVGSDAT